MILYAYMYTFSHKRSNPHPQHTLRNIKQATQQKRSHKNTKTNTTLTLSQIEQSSTTQPTTGIEKKSRNE
ncbi:hypothetical protein HYC85_014037 [Camellia sinensis]|uniref:Uncharacterized protein n=1 Tax=Camellia sinensis TaxID=4442 RepID=A0A7J7H544_CAMSI|nr:hypothetical protein HYC85_014037 [Camellia sinensis]